MPNIVVDYSKIATLKKAKEKLGKLWFLLYNQCLCDPCLCRQRFKNAFLGHIWDSPSDTLQDKVCMKAPFTRKTIQATTHKAILDIGYSVEQNILNEHEVEKQAALEEHRKRLLERCQGSILELIKDAEAVERAACTREMQHLTEEFESQLADQLLGLQLKMEKEFEMSKTEHTHKMQAKLEAKIKAAVAETTRYITKQLLEEIGRQAKVVEKQFKAEFKMNDIKRQYESDKQVSEFRKTMHEARQRLECKNIANMLYILCMERRKCLEEKELIEDYYLTFKLKLLKRVSKQKEKIDKLKNELNHQIKQVELRESCCREIIRQYQKFINFALRASPTQAQFLLSIQKLLSFELSKPKLKSNPCLPVRNCDTLLQWAHVEEATHQEAVPGLVIDDHHDCLNELALPKRESNTELPAFTYKDKLYVRQDFRNLISQGIDLSPSHDLWSEDIELLVKTLRASISDIDVKQDSADLDDKNIDEPEPVEIAFIRPSSMRLRSDVEKSEHEEVTKASSNEKLGETGFLEQEKSTLKPDVSRHELVDEPCLLGARNSIEITLEKGSVRSLRSKHVDIDETADEEIDYSAFETMHQVIVSRPEIRTSVVTPSEPLLAPKEERTSLTVIPVQQHSVVQFKKEPSPLEVVEAVDVEVKKTASKLVTARDSVANLRESRQALLEPAPISNIKQARRRPPLSTTVQVKEICCEKCPKRHSLESEDELKNIKKTSSGDLQKLLKSHENVLARVFPQGISNTNLVDFYPEKLEKLYKQPKPKGKKKKSDAHKSKKVAKSIKTIEEDELSMDRIPVNNDATIGKMRSFISELSDNPELIKLFTACQR